MPFRIMALVTTVAGGLLGLRWLFAGRAILAQWGVEATDGALLVARRIGALYLGLAVLFLLGQSAAPSELRSAVCLGMAVAIALLACLGLFELRAGRADAGIYASVVVETVLAAGFVWAWRSGR